LVIHAPGQANGLVWNRPVAVEVQAPGEEMQVLPVYDRTRLAQLLILGVGLLGSALIWLIFRKRSNFKVLGGTA
jgi:NADH/NAD ratio-sensing transcriptional regulator Rex